MNNVEEISQHFEALKTNIYVRYIVDVDVIKTYNMLNELISDFESLLAETKAVIVADNKGEHILLCRKNIEYLLKGLDVISDAKEILAMEDIVIQ